MAVAYKHQPRMVILGVGHLQDLKHLAPILRERYGLDLVDSDLGDCIKVNRSNVRINMSLRISFEWRSEAVLCP
jgi:hypothetical protein